MTNLSNGSVKLTEEQIEDLLYCSRTGDLTEIKEILGERESFDEILQECQNHNEANNSPLHYASANGHLDIVKDLIGKCTLSTLISQNESGNTPLHWAAFNGQLEVVKVLIDRIEALAPQPTSNGDKELTEEERDAQAEEQTRQRSVWDVVNKAGRGPMSEAQMNNKEAVVDYMLERMVTAPTGAPSDEAVPEQDTEKPAKENELADKAQDLSLGNDK